MSYNKNKVIAFNYFGGKYTHLDFILKRLPETKTYVEVFGGSAVVLLNKKPSPIECYNDLNENVYNFFKVLRTSPNKLLTQIYLTPYSRKEYQLAYKTYKKGSDLERARKFFVTVNQSFNGTLSRQTGWKLSTLESRAKVSESISRWNSKLPHLITIIERLKNVQIGNYDFRAIFEKFDGKDTLFYCDPPYIHETRCNTKEYECELTLDDHYDLINIAKNLKGKIAISGYDNKYYNKLLPDFYKSVAGKKSGGFFHSNNREMLWTNYDPTKIIHDLFNQPENPAQAV